MEYSSALNYFLIYILDLYLYIIFLIDYTSIFQYIIVFIFNLEITISITYSL